MRKGFLSLGLVLTLALPAFAGQAASAKAAQTKAPTAVVNLNTASESDLVALPGVGPATAKKIMAGRPYTSVADLAKAGVPKNTIEKISSMVTVGAACGPQILRPARRCGARHGFTQNRSGWSNDTGCMPRRRPSWLSTVRRLLGDLWTFIRLGLASHAQLAAENLFLRKQLALYRERQTKPGRPDPATRVALVLLSRVLDWRSLLTVVKPDTLIRWHRQGWRLLWRWKSWPGRPPIPADLQRLIVIMCRANPTWGEERIANELLLKLASSSLG